MNKGQFKRLRRVRINIPHPDHPDHALHGERGLAIDESPGYIHSAVNFYFLQGDKVCMLIDPYFLSDGWRE